MFNGQLYTVCRLQNQQGKVSRFLGTWEHQGYISICRRYRQDLTLTLLLTSDSTYKTLFHVGLFSCDSSSPLIVLQRRAQTRQKWNVLRCRSTSWGFTCVLNYYVVIFRQLSTMQLSVVLRARRAGLHQLSADSTLLINSNLCHKGRAEAEETVENGNKIAEKTALRFLLTSSFLSCTSVRAHFPRAARLWVSVSFRAGRKGCGAAAV